VTVNLTPRAWHALEATVQRTGDTKTETINRALQVYNYLDETHALRRRGVRPRPTGQTKTTKDLLSAGINEGNCLGAPPREGTSE
jgi:hypothetical protein